jgi:hypothetical protein
MLYCLHKGQDWAGGEGEQYLREHMGFWLSSVSLSRRGDPCSHRAEALGAGAPGLSLLQLHNVLREKPGPSGPGGIARRAQRGPLLASP